MQLQEYKPTILSESDQIWRNELIKRTAKETRLPIPRVMMLTWAQFELPNIIRTPTHREVRLDPMLAQAIRRLPYCGRYIFSMSPFPPTIPDEYLDPAREFIEKKKWRPSLLKKSNNRDNHKDYLLFEASVIQSK